MAMDEPVRVRSSTSPANLGVFLANHIWPLGTIALRAVGAGAVLVAVQAVAHASALLRHHGLVLSVTPGFDVTMEDGRELTVLVLRVKARAVNREASKDDDDDAKPIQEAGTAS